jgi:transcriptional regulator with XRE-family HTH domain
MEVIQMDMTINERIIVLRTRANLHQEDMARAMSMSRATYAGRESGESSWRLTELARLGEILGVTVAELMGVGK